METKQAIQASAQVVRITSISPGDVYKRFEDGYDDRTYYGVVQAVHNDGEKAIISATEYCTRYSSLEVSHKVLHGHKDYILFPASPEELNFELDRAKEQKVKEIESCKDKIVNLHKQLEDIDGLISGETQKKLATASYQEMSQAEFDHRKKLAL